MTTCPDEGSFSVDKVTESNMDGCYTLVEDRTYNGLHYFASSEAEVVEDGIPIVFGTISVNDSHLVWTVAYYPNELTCIDALETDATTLHPTGVSTWNCWEDDTEDFTLLDHMTATCGCSTSEPTPGPTPVLELPTPVLSTTAPSTPAPVTPVPVTPAFSTPSTLPTLAPLDTSEPHASELTAEPASAVFTPEPSAYLTGFIDTPSPSPSSLLASSSSPDEAPVGLIVGTLAGAVALAAIGVFFWRRRAAKKTNDDPPPVSHAFAGDDVGHGGAHGQQREVGSHASIVTTAGNRSSGLPSQQNYSNTNVTHERDGPPPPYQHTGGVATGIGVDDLKHAIFTAPHVRGAVQPRTEQIARPDGVRAIADGYGKRDEAPEQLLSTTATNSTANVSTGEQSAGAAIAYCPEDDAFSGESGHPSTADSRSTSSGIGYGQAVMAAAQELAQHCQIPGVSEAATVVSILVRLVSDCQDDVGWSEAKIRRCRSIVMMLERAAKVLGKGGETNGEVARLLIEDVHDALSDVVELIKTYQSRNKLSRVLMSTLFKRRQDELDAAVDRAILRLHLGLHVQVGHDVSAVKEGMHQHRESLEEAMSEARAQARSAKRQRKLNQLEIPEDHVVITDELLGKGGFGEVFIADYNGRNAAAKVQFISHSFGRLEEVDVLDGPKGGEHGALQQQKNQRKAFLRELDIMIRLRSPHTVNVYGAITSLPDRLVLVMELLAGGDLRNLLKQCEHSLPEEQCRQIIRDICAGMCFLHSKATVHGDLKSANILLDGRGRAKIGDFGTSRWAPNTENSTGLITHATKAGPSINISFAWTAPEVLEKKAASEASDVYSFGVVVWEILTRQIPWAGQALPRDIYLRVVVHGDRPAMPVETPADIADVVRDSWAQAPEDRPTFEALMGVIRVL